MNNKMLGLFMFTIGAAVGSIVTLKVMKEKYERIAQEEIDSVKEIFRKKYDASDNEQTSEEECEEESDDENQNGSYSEYLEHANAYAGNNTKTLEEALEGMKPHVIPPDEFGEEDDYETVTLYYYADGVLASEYDGVVEDVDDIVGIESLSTFGYYEPDSVFVRNDRLKTDYEILRSLREYSEVIDE